MSDFQYRLGLIDLGVDADGCDRGVALREIGLCDGIVLGPTAGNPRFEVFREGPNAATNPREAIITMLEQAIIAVREHPIHVVQWPK